VNHQGTMTPYRIGWRTRSRFTHWWRRWHRPWQSESDVCRFARRSFTAAGALRKMRRDDAAARIGRRTAYQRLRLRYAQIERRLYPERFPA
jgi:hypothetical protein